MADKQRGSKAKTTTKRRSSLPSAVMGAVGDLVTAARSSAEPVPKKARRKIKKLGKQLDAARATEAKRLRQSAKARQDAERRDRQAADAAARMASIVSTIRDTASGAVAKPANARKPAAATKPAVARKPAAARKAAATGKPAAKPAGATKAATTAKARTRRRATAAQPAKPTGRPPTTTPATNPKPTA
jgi:hypothetical protein